MKSEDYDDFERQLLRSSRQDGLPAAKRERIAAAVCRAVDKPGWTRNASSASRFFSSRFGLPIWVKASLFLFAGTASAFVAVRENLLIPAAPVVTEAPTPKARLRSTRRHHHSDPMATLPAANTEVVAEVAAVPVAQVAMEPVADVVALPNTVVGSQPALAPPPARRSTRTLAYLKAQSAGQASPEPRADSLAPLEPPKTVEQTYREPAASLVAAEVDILQKVRSALLEKNAPLAMARLRDYGAARPNGGMLAEEAEILAIDALLLAGDQIGAGRAIEVFLASRPNSGKTGRLRALIATPATKRDPDQFGRPFTR